MAASRRTVTVVFCDVVDWTPLGAAVDPEVLRDRQTRYHLEARVVLERHGGTVEKFIGDAVMAVFGWPSAHEDDALRAVRAAAELRDRLADLQVRIGINTGEVAAGAGDALVTGDAVNLAKRLEQAAATGSVLVGAGTRALVTGAVELAPVTPLALKGVEGHTTAWRVVDVLGDARPYGRRLDAPFVGRHAELRRLQRELGRTDEGCRLVTVVGQPGIGKSRLAFEFGELARAQATVISGRCLPYGEGITFWPLAEAVREAGGDPALAADETDQLFRRARRLFEELASPRPLVVVFEDIHWGEPAFLDLLEYLVGWSRVAPILILCLARPELFEARPDWPREGVLTLEPLSAEDSGALVDALDASLDEDTRRRIREVAEGNPLFVEQLSAAAAEGELTVPPTLQALLAARLDRLDERERDVIEGAAVIGRDFSAAQVASLSPLPAVESTLLALARRELVRPGAGEDGFSFRHILIREAAYAAIPKRRRADLHERAAELVAAEELAGYHLEQAHRYRAELGEADSALAARAAALLGAAGLRAFDRADPAARKLLERAIALAVPDDPLRPELLYRLSDTVWIAGDPVLAHALLDEALAAALAAGDRRVEWYVRIAQARRRTMTEKVESADALERVGREAMSVFRSLDDESGLARAGLAIAVARQACGRFGDAQAAAEQALVHATRAGTAQEQAGVVDNLCISLLYGPEPAAAAAGRCRELLEERPGNPLLEANVLSALVGLESMRGDFDETRALLVRAHAIYEELGTHLLRAGLSEVAGPALLLAGDAAGAEAELRLALAVLGAESEGSFLGFVGPLLAQALLAQGRVDEASECARLGMEAAPEDSLETQILWRVARTRIDAQLGRPAVELAREAVALAERTDALTLQGDAFSALAEALELDGERAAADSALAGAESAYHRKGNVAAAAAARSLARRGVRR